MFKHTLNSMALMIKDFKLSLTSFSFYKDIADYSLFRIFRYFTFMIALFASIVTVMDLDDAVEDAYRFTRTIFKGRFPQVDIVDGQLSTDLKEPYVVTISSPKINFLKNYALVVDTSGRTSDLGPDYPKGLLFMKDRVLIKRDFRKKSMIDLKKVSEHLGPIHLNNHNIEGFRSSISMFVFLFSWTLFFSKMLFTHMILLLFISCVAFLYGRTSNINVAFTSVISMSVYALTPGILLAILLTLLNFHTVSILAAQLICTGAFLTRAVTEYK